MGGSSRAAQADVQASPTTRLERLARLVDCHPGQARGGPREPREDVAKRADAREDVAVGALARGRARASARMAPDVIGRGVLDGLFVAPAAAAVSEALASAHADGPVAVLGNARLATALATTHAVVPVGISARAAKKLTGAVTDLAALGDRQLVALVGTEVADITTLQAWTQAIVDGGVLILVERGGKPTDASRRALCAGLTELEQRVVGRTVVTSGLVTHL